MAQELLNGNPENAIMTSSDTSSVARPSTSADDLRKKTLEHLQKHHTMSLATDGPQGLWSATVFYINVGFDLYFQSNIATRHAQNLIARPRVAGTINVDADHWGAIKGLQLEGWASRITGREEQERVKKAFVTRYPFVDSLWGAEESGVEVLSGHVPTRAIFRVHPDRVVYYDHEYADQPRELSDKDLAESSSF